MNANSKILLLRIFTLSVIFISIFSVFYFRIAPIEPKIPQPFIEIQRFLRQNQPDSAIIALRSFLTKDTTHHPTAYYLLGKSYLQKDQLHLARSYCVRSLESNPDQSEIKSLLAEIDFDLAKSYWDRNKKESLFYLISVIKNTQDKNLLVKVAQLTGGSYKIEQLTNDIFCDGGPSFSPDGKRIIYHSDTSYFSEEYPLRKKIIKKSKLFLLDLITNKKVCLTQKGYSESFARFSADGESIIFQREIPLAQSSEYSLNIQQNLILKNLETNEERQITSDTLYEGLASFFPNGEEITYVKGYSIHIMNLKTKQTKNIYSLGENILTKTKVQSLLRPISPFYPNISPDGGKIVFQAGFKQRRIYLMDLRSSDTICLISGNKEELYPSFSSDGKRILFVSNDELYLMDTNGKNRTKLTNDRSQKKDPSFSPDGKKIIFCAKPKEKEEHYFEIYLLNLEETISKTQLNERLKRIAQNL